MTVHCIWEHNGPDTLLYAADFPGAYARGACLEEALNKMPQEISRYIRWAGGAVPAEVECVVSEEVASSLLIRDADSDVLFSAEREPLTNAEYAQLKALALRSAQDIQALFDSIPDPQAAGAPFRKTFYGAVPRTAEEMYLHARNVNDYYFGEVGIAADHEGTILACRERGFAALEQQPDFLANAVFDGSYGEQWSLRKVIRRFIWHDRIHARAMYRMAVRAFPQADIRDPFFFA